MYTIFDYTLFAFESIRQRRPDLARKKKRRLKKKYRVLRGVYVAVVAIAR